MNLYQINQEIEILLNDIDFDTGEMTNEAYQALENLEIALEDKALNLAKWIKSMDAEAEAIKLEEKNLATRRKSIERRSDSIKDYLTLELDGKAFRDSQAVISWRKSESVNILDENRVPDIYKKITLTVSKTAIKDAIKAGVDVDGAEIKTNNLMSIK